MTEVLTKSSNRLGVIDCGTNTFHLLVVDVDCVAQRLERIEADPDRQNDIECAGIQMQTQ